MRIKASVAAGSKKEALSERDGVFAIAVREKAARNEANTRVRELIAEYFGTAPGRVRILTGHRSPKKTIEIDLPA
jgi:uncharacterized protein YggU (UPF0235/DUF167 family)